MHLNVLLWRVEDSLLQEAQDCIYLTRAHKGVIAGVWMVKHSTSVDQITHD